MKNRVVHKTVVIQKKFNHKQSEVYKAFSLVKSRAKWCAPKGDAIIYLKSNFKNGGMDVFKCGPLDSLHFKGTAHYENIVKNERIVSTETISHQKKILFTSLNTIELIPLSKGTKLIMISQIASYVGSDVSKGFKQGWALVLGNLEEFLNGK